MTDQNAEQTEQIKTQKRPALGQKVSFKAIASKYRNGRNTIWIRMSNFCDKRITGIYVGCRTVYDGKTTYEPHGYGGEEDADYEWAFERNAHREVWLIVINERRNPIAVFPDDVEWNN